MSTRVGRNEPCPCGSGRKYKKCCLGRPAAEPTEEAPHGGFPHGELTLIIDTPRGPMVRLVPSASPLSTGMRHGDAAEAAAHDAAAIWGLPDFVFLPGTAAVGSGTREVGDGILIVGKLGVVIQVKARETPTDDPEKERRWLEKNTAAGIRQGNGTVRKLKEQPRELTNLRNRSVEIDGNAHRWLVVVVLDHAAPPDDVTPPHDEAKHPTVVLLRRDWEFLFDQLKSTYAVVQYLARVAGEPIALGKEPLRYYDLAQEDAATTPAPFPAELLAGGEVVSEPLLPLAPVAHSDRRAHAMVRAIFEDIAATRLREATEQDRLRVLSELDGLPVAQRARIGQFVLDAMDQVSRDAEGGIAWRLRSVRGRDGRTHLGFGACSHPYTDEIRGAFGWWAQLRHHDVRQASGTDNELTTVAVLLTPRTDGERPWDTTMCAVSGELNLTDEELGALRSVWPTPPEWDRPPSTTRLG
jgi:hypothetical protein